MTSFTLCTHPQAIGSRIRPWLLASLFLLPLFSLAQAGPDTYYETKWKVVDSLVDKKGLPESALTQVNAIYTRARQEKNDVQVIKALIYRISIQEMNHENAAAKAIDELSQEIPAARQPARSILQSILAGAYWNYFQQNRWKLYQRTATSGVVKEDIGTWGPVDFHKKLGELFLSSIREEKLLQNTKLDLYDPILVKGNSRNLRPTLFDLLAHRALDYFKTDERDIDRPAYAFEIDDPAIFADAAGFSAHTFRTTDTLSLHFIALQLYQRLLRFHLPELTPAALLDLDIQRLNFGNAYAVTDNKEALYEQALARITDRYDNEPAAAEAWYLQAQQYANKAEGYDPLKDTANRYANVTAKNICEKVLAEKDNSEGRVHCESLLNNIQRRSLELQTEKVNLPGQPLRSLVSWRNFTGLNIRIIQLDRATREGLGNNTYQDAYWKNLLQLPVLRAFSRDLPATGDYQEHRAEIKIDALPVGEYALVASASPSFELGKNPLAVQFFYVSSIAFINNGHDYFVLNRESGQPLPGADVRVWYHVYDYKLSRNVLTRSDESYRTDAHGYFLLKDRADQSTNIQRLLEIRAGNDHLFVGDAVTYNNYTGSRESEDKRYNTTFLFTDRSIYRPGQTAYFKGIMVSRDPRNNRSTILAGFHTKIFLYDANQGKVDSLLLTTNEFGSYKGQFRLPENLLNGEFRIEDDSTGNEATIAVEEYKRPKFYVEYDKLKGSHRVGDTIRVSGTAKAYAGNNIDGAMVKYRVLRQARYPWFYSWRRPAAVRGQEIAHGEIKTDAAGRFSILFTAVPDRSVPEKSDPVFEYTVSADITDINGETRSGQTVARVGYTTLELSFLRPLEDRLPADSLTSLAVRATNLSGEPEPALVDVSVYPLQSPDRLIRTRYWSQADQFLMNKEEYLGYFPHDEYGDELNEEKWAKGDKVFGTTDSAGKPLLLPGAPGKKILPGWYAIEARSKDAYGHEVKGIRYLELYDGRTGAPANPQYDWSPGGRQAVEPGAKAKVEIGSSAGDVLVIRKVERDADQQRPKGSEGGDAAAPFTYLTLDKERQTTEFPVTESDRGGFGVLDVFVKDNRVYTHQHTVQVPWTNKELTISYGSFRDKTLPGSKEQWKVKIAGYKADKVAAEAVAGMYDASLDAFRPHAWSTPDLYPLYQGRAGWEAAGGFTMVASQRHYEQERVFREYIKLYDALLNREYRGGVEMLSRRMLAQAMVKGRIAPGAYRNSGDMLVHADKMGFGKPSVIQVPDMANDPDGSKGLMRDTLFIGDDESRAPVPAQAPDQSPVQTRKNFSETAFFFPELRTDSDGNLDLSFTMPEALTRWKMMMLAHTRDLSFGYSEKTIVTQKQLMVQPNTPRFLREGDRMEISIKVVNMTDSELTGQMQLELTDPTTGKTADGWYTNRQPNQYFTAGARQSAIVNFPIDIPYQYNRPLTYRVTARAGSYSDGEEATLPVVSNRMLVTESLPLNMPGDGTRTFKFDKLLQSGSSETLNHHALTVEFTGNPAWYAIQALPYLMEYPHECAEQTFNRFYANALASKVANSSPRIQEIFRRWRNLDTAALLSNLEKNPELKSVLLQETPWVLQGKSESQQKKNIALLFDMVRMSRELESSLNKLMDMQGPNGGFVWFKGGPDDRYITQYILTGIGRLQKLNALPAATAGQVKAIVRAALPYLDQLAKKDYKAALAAPAAAGKIRWIGDLPAQYLYMRSFFPDQGIPGDVFPAINYFRKQVQQSWQQSGKFMQGMIALALYRTGDIRTAKEIMASLRENAIRDEEKGMYWKGMEGGYYWYQAPVETQSLLIEAYHTISPDVAVERDCKTWLLKQKQTHNWATTRATADACYALLLEGSDVLTAEREVTIRLGDKTIAAAGTEAGTGYFKKVFDGPFVNPSMGNITLTMATAPAPGDRAGQKGGSAPASAGSLPAWGAVYWQYFENLDRITAAGGAKPPLKLVKKIFIAQNTDRGLVLQPVPENGTLKPGDKVIVRIELQSDRDLEYVHMKDMRASCMEPVNVISSYKWQGGLGYYESTKDASTDFFFSRLPRGTYVFEYPLFAGQLGNFSNGVTSVECMYAPEFSFHSEGIRINVEAQ